MQREADLVLPLIERRFQLIAVGLAILPFVIFVQQFLAIDLEADRATAGIEVEGAVDRRFHNDRVIAGMLERK